MINLLTRSVFDDCFALKKGEAVLVVTDEYKQKEAELFVQAARRKIKKVKLIKFAGMTDNAQEPPAKIAKAMKAADVVLLVTKFSLSHTKARKAACRAGARIASLPGITLPMIKRTLTGDYSQISKLSKRLAAILTKGKKVSITSPGGTKLTADISGRKAIADDGNLTKKGAFGNLPAGEAFLAPQEGTTNGVLVVDGSLAEIKLDRPLTVTIKDGIITDLSGGKAVAKFRKAILAAGPKAKVVAELGIGTNPQAIVSPEVLEAEKVLGTCHIAFGNNVGFGGKNDVAFHSDGVVLNPTITVDGKKILSQG